MYFTEKEMQSLSLQRVIFKVICFLCPILALFSCSSDQVNTSFKTANKPLTLLISIDGFKPEYLERQVTPNLQHIIHQGSIAKGLISSFPILLPFPTITASLLACILIIME
jgi:predicted AlkP superfamily pyrophosphatase or phosphodiesterase